MTVTSINGLEHAAQTHLLGVKVSDDEIDSLPMARQHCHGDWNCTSIPSGPSQPTAER